MIIILLGYVNDSLKTQLFNTVWEAFAECFEKHRGPMHDSNKINIRTSK